MRRLHQVRARDIGMFGADATAVEMAGEIVCGGVRCWRAVGEGVGFAATALSGVSLLRGRR
jgi:hypothetical protein